MSDKMKSSDSAPLKGAAPAGQRRDNKPSQTPEESPFVEKLININRVAKVVKGGKNMSFSALTAVGDGNGSVGLGFGKATEVTNAIKKSTDSAKKDMQNFSEVLTHGRTIPHQVVGRYSAARVMLKPASPGTGVIAGGAVRAVLESMGIKDILTKSMGTANPINVGKATIDALEKLESIRMVAKRRGLPVERLKR